jgi:hypothetical protein
LTRLTVALLALLAVVAAGAPARGLSSDYDPARSEWNGLSELATLGVSIEATDHLDWNSLVPEQDILLIIYPRTTVDAGALLGWIESGGSVLLADDFGRADQAFSMLGLERVPARGVVASRFHEDNVALPIATARDVAHPLARGVSELVTNHPSMFHGRDDATVFGFGPGQAVVVAGTRGTGRFVALSDPSVLINGMLAFPGNLSFAANVLAWLKPGAGARRAVLLTGTFVATGTPPLPAHTSLGLPGAAEEVSALGHELRELRLWTPDRIALRALAMTAAVLLLLLVIWRVPLLRRPSGPDLAWASPPAGHPQTLDPEGMVKLIDQAGSAGAADFAPAAALLREHLEAQLERAGGVIDPFRLPPPELLRVVRARSGESAARALEACEAAQCRGLPSRAALTHWRAVSRRDFERVYDATRQLDAALAEQS